MVTMRLVNADALREGLQNLAYDDWNQGISISVALVALL